MKFQQILFGCLLLVTLALSAPSVNTKIEPNLSVALQTKNSVNIFIKFQGGNRPAIRSAERLRFATRTQKIDHLVAGLKSLSASTQHNALSLLQIRNRAFSSSDVSYKQIWATNELYVNGATNELIDMLSALPEVTEIREEQVVSLEELTFRRVEKNEQTDNSSVEWTLEKIEAVEAWQLPGGSNGAGVVVANIDSGVRYSHEALRDNFREEYGWLDPYSGSELPLDEGGHGTHTMGTLAGSNGIGVAPGVKWIACRGCDKIFCTEAALKACGQWTLCPTLANGQSPNCSQAPQLVSNSWGGRQGSDWYNDIIDAWKAAGIIPIFSNGNSGPSCGTAGSPGDQDVIAVGATTTADRIWESSSVGPSVQGVLKPDISAPGHEVRSSGHTSDDHYFVTSGTSMACPHVSGVVALMLARNPNLTYSEVKEILEQSAERNSLVDTGMTCGGIPSTQFPNNQYGHGRLNARRAVEDVLGSIQ